MAKVLIDDSALIDIAEKFEHARALFDVLEDEVQHEPRAYALATIGMHLTFDASCAVGKLFDSVRRTQTGEEVPHD